VHEDDPDKVIYGDEISLIIISLSVTYSCMFREWDSSNSDNEKLVELDVTA
jgi:hypothetical protein